MKACVISLNLSKGLAIESHLQDKNIPFKYFYDFADISLINYEETSEGIQKYIDSIYNNHDIFIEFPVAFEYEYVYNKNPDTKFIYVDINKDIWIEKMNGLKNISFKNSPYPFEEYFCKKYLNTDVKEIKNLTNTELSQIYDAHILGINVFFSDKENFIKINIDDPLFFEIFDNFLSI